MAALLRNTARLTRSALQLQQRRHVGDLPVKPNKYIEQWAARRELVEEEFKWDAKTITQVVTFGLLVPYAIYAVIVKEYERVDDRAGRPRRQVWGGEA